MSIFNFNLFGPQCQQSGFLLLEVGIALFVGSIMAISLASWYVTVVDEYDDMIKTLDGLLYACTIIEYMRADKIAIPRDLGPNKYTISIEHDHQFEHFEFVTVTVEWLHKKIRRNIRLSTGIIVK